MQKKVILGVTGGIAIYKSCYLVRQLKALGYDVVVIMTKNATEFVTPLTFESLTGNRAIVDTFDRNFDFEIEHVSLAKSADIFVVAPATANFIAKAANGIADDMLSTTFLAFKKQKLICPAMNTGMYIDEATQANLQNLKQKGICILEPTTGKLACNDEGIGKMVEPEQIALTVKELLKTQSDYCGKKVLITAGATIESIDGVRFVSNRSSGKMGIALAEAVTDRGGEVILIKGNVQLAIPKQIDNVIGVLSTQQMYEAVMSNYQEADLIIMAAAPSDFTPSKVYDNKLKVQNLTVEFVRTPDIAAALGKVKGQRKLVIFSAETTNVYDNSLKKLISKNADMVVANDVTKQGAGFDVDTNIITIITKEGKKEYDIADKYTVANYILDNVYVR